MGSSWIAIEFLEQMMRVVLAYALLLLSASAGADRLHLVIPAGPGGGLDSTARAIGHVLMDDNRMARVSYENRSGGGGGKAMAYFVEAGDTLQDTLLVNSTPLLVRSLQGLFPHSYKDLVPVAGLIADPAVVAVRGDSPIQDWPSLAAALQAEPARVFIGGGSVRGSLDHIVTSLLANAIAVEPRSVRYLPYDGGGKAMLALLGGEVQVLVSGLGETLSQHQSGSVRILGVASAARSDELPEIATFNEMGTQVVFSNWRGLFAAQQMPRERVKDLIGAVTSAVASPAWKQQLKRYGWQAQFIPGDEFATYLEDQETILKSVLMDLGLIR